MKKIYTLIFFIYISLAWDLAAQNIPLCFSGNDNATIGVRVVDIATGDVVADYNSSILMTPASITKCITSATCIVGLPSDFRFTTAVAITGEVKNKTLIGNLIIKGSGDPTLDSRHFLSNANFIENTISELKRYGIDSIAGDIVPDYQEYPVIGYSKYWMMEDVGWDYGTGLYGINYRDNTINLVFENRYSNEYTCSPNADIKVFNCLKKGENDIQLYPALNNGTLLITGSAPDLKKALTLKCANHVPFISIVNDIAQSIPLGRANISSLDTTIIYSHKSPSRDEILRSLMVRSDNLYAQGMLRALLADSVGIIRDDANAIDAEIKTLKSIGVECANQKIVDGCGLARNSKITPRFMADLLIAMTKNGHGSSYVASFPIAGVDGTVKRLLRNTRLSGSFALKSGSMSGVLCYAGYKLDEKRQPTHAIVIMVNNYSCKTSEIRSAIEHYLLKIF